MTDEEFLALLEDSFKLNYISPYLDPNHTIKLYPRRELNENQKKLK